MSDDKLTKIETQVNKIYNCLVGDLNQKGLITDHYELKKDFNKCKENHSFENNLRKRNKKGWLVWALKYVFQTLQLILIAFLTYKVFIKNG